MSKTKRHVVLYCEGRMGLSSPAERSKIESAGAKFVYEGVHRCASLSMAWPSRIEFNFPNSRPVGFLMPKLKGPPLKARQEDIVRQLLMPRFLESSESIACTEANREKNKKNKEQYEKAVYGKIRNEKEARQRDGAEFLRGLQLAEFYHRENPSRGNEVLPLIALIRTVYGSSLFEALIGNNAEFVQGILEQMGHWLSERRQLKKRLIEIDEIRHPTGAEPTTWKDIWQKYCPDHIDRPQNFQKLLRECGIPFPPVGEFDRKRVQNRRKNTR
jgi:hypothetical protein